MIAVSNIEFIETMFADMQDDCAAILAGFVGDPGSPPDFAWTRRPWQFGEQLHRSVHRDANTYTAISSFRADSNGQFRRRKDQFARLHAVMFDDVGTKVSASRLVLHPSALIETSPGNFQAYLFIAPSDDADNGPRCSMLIEALVDKGLSAAVDPGMKGVTRYGRLPVGLNGKAKYVSALGAPFRVRIESWDPDRRYTVLQIAAAYGLDLRAKVPQSRIQPSGSALARVNGFLSLLEVVNRAGLYFGETNGAWHAIVCPWVDTHTDRAETGSALCEPGPQNNWAGGFRCHHGHCEKRGIADVYAWARSQRSAA